jgi:hypothetical protein
MIGNAHYPINIKYYKISAITRKVGEGKYWSGKWNLLPDDLNGPVFILSSQAEDVNTRR